MSGGAARGAGVACVLAALALAPACRSDDPAAPASGGTGEATIRGPSDTVNLYFAGSRGRLVAEDHEIAATPEPEERIARVVAALLAGPREEGLYPPFPLSAEQPVEVLDVHLSAGGVAYVDLGATAFPTPPLSGSRGELLTVYGLVNSILLNVPEARGVVLLWNGRQRSTFGGHLDTTRPLSANSDWVESGA